MSEGEREVVKKGGRKEKMACSYDRHFRMKRQPVKGLKVVNWLRAWCNVSISRRGRESIPISSLRIFINIPKRIKYTV